MAIKLVRLKSGEDLVADIDINTDAVTLENPAMIMPVGNPGTGGQVQMGFGPWVPFAKSKTFEVPREHIVFIADPADDIVNNYRQMFGSGIVVPEVKVNTKQVLTG